MKVLGYSVLLLMWGCCTAQEEGQKCGPTPFIANGDVDGTRKPAYSSGTYVDYKCQSYYTLYGPTRIKCQNGAWSAPPECLEPCTANPHEMAANNLQLKWTFSTKLYIKHGDLIEFDCKSRDYIKDTTSSYRVKCNRGTLIYPKCIKPGSCLLSPTEMESTNVITDRENTEILNEESVVFTCKPGFYRISGIDMKVSCNNGILNYPECSRTSSVCSPPPQIEHGSIIGDLKEQYSPDSSVEYTCQTHYELEGAQRWTCTGGIWTADAPVCRQEACDAPAIDHGSVVDLRPPYANAATVQFKCEVGYTLKNNGKTICSKGEWFNLPSCLSTACYSAPKVQDALIVGDEKKIYSSDEKVFYNCKLGFAFEKLPYTICQEGQWTETPVCKREGQKCGPAPSIANGDVDGARKDSYNSGTFVGYKCQSYYILEGTTQVTCRNGSWSALPQCLEPCTVSSQELAENNIQLRWTEQTKLYIKHKDRVEFNCMSEHFVKDKASIFRPECNRGKLTYPKCIKRGSCVISQADMEQKNVFTERENTEVPNGVSVSFTCKPGFYSTPGKDMKGECINGNLNYPECGSTPLLCSPPPHIEHGSIKGGQKQYQHESSVEYTCDEGYALEAIRRLTCTGGSWSADAPVCRQSCYLSQAELSRNNLELLQADQIDEPVQHKQSVVFKCKEGYIEQTSLELSGHCDNGNIIYPVCAENLPCKVTSEKLDEHNLEVHEKHRKSVNFRNGAIIEFKCKSGFRRPPSLLVTCDQGRIIYPTCFSKTPCRILQEDMDTNNVVLHEKHEEVIYQNNAVIEFKCKIGFFETGPLSATCFQSKIAYPKCLSEKPCLLSKELIENNNLQFSAISGNIDYIEDGKTIDFSCKDQYRQHVRSSDLSQVCEKGIITYPICVWGQA